MKRATEEIKELELREKLKILYLFLRTFIPFIVFDDNKKELQHYMNMLEISEPGGYIMSIEFGERDDKGNISNKIGFSVRRDSISICQKYNKILL